MVSKTRREGKQHTQAQFYTARKYKNLPARQDEKTPKMPALQTTIS